MQSESLLLLQPAGQQPSPEVQFVILAWVHAAVQVAAEPVSESTVQAFPSSQLVAHAPAPEAIPLSQVSPDSTTPLPQTALQSESLLLLQPAGQQPSPEVQFVMLVWVHAVSPVPQ
jgi:hypothetical protein